jgi:1,4-alpha-glucan branching enzyme
MDHHSDHQNAGYPLCKGVKVKDDVIIVCNFTVIRENYRIGIPRKGKFKAIF